jgi:hypothetical protein
MESASQRAVRRDPRLEERPRESGDSFGADGADSGLDRAVADESSDLASCGGCHRSLRSGRVCDSAAVRRARAGCGPRACHAHAGHPDSPGRLGCQRSQSLERRACDFGCRSHGNRLEHARNRRAPCPLLRCPLFGSPPNEPYRSMSKPPLAASLVRFRLRVPSGGRAHHCHYARMVVTRVLLPRFSFRQLRISGVLSGTIPPSAVNVYRLEL